MVVVLCLLAVSGEPLPAVEVAELHRLATARYPGLVYCKELSDDSQAWAVHLAESGQFYHGRGVRENIARGYATPAAVMGAWFRSRGHNAQFRRGGRVGYGVARHRGRVVWVCRFAPL